MQIVSQKKLSEDGFMQRTMRGGAIVIIAGVIGIVSGCASWMGPNLDPLGKVRLNARSEVPSVKSKATGSGIIKIATDRSVIGSISTTNIDATAAHIHLASKSDNGPAIVSLTKTAENTWSVPEGVKLTDTQYAAYVAGDLYVNVHSAAFPDGEIRGQIISH